jgi:hypothetical protein
VRIGDVRNKDIWKNFGIFILPFREFERISAPSLAGALSTGITVQRSPTDCGASLYVI